MNGHLFVSLVAQFQSFARTLHDEALDSMRSHSRPATTLADLAARNRRLDRGNPSPSALAEDFGRLGLSLLPTLQQRSSRNAKRLERLGSAVIIRNAIAHEDRSQLARVTAGRSQDRAVPTLTSYRTHRRALNALAAVMDAVVAEHLVTLIAEPPW